MNNIDAELERYVKGDLDDRQKYLLKIRLRVEPKSLDICKICLEENDVFKKNAYRNSNICYEHAMRVIRYGGFMSGSLVDK